VKGGYIYLNVLFTASLFIYSGGSTISVLAQNGNKISDSYDPFLSHRYSSFNIKYFSFCII